MVSSLYGEGVEGSGRVSGFPGDLEWRARLSRRRGDSQREGAGFRGHPEPAQGTVWLVSILGQVFLSR